MQKESFYFPHYCNARHDRKIKRIQKDLGLEGYGMFFMLLEVLREQSDFRYPYCDLDLLADEFGTSVAKLEVVINNYQLFTIDEDKMFFSPKLIMYLQPYLNMKAQRQLAAKKSVESRQKKKLTTVEQPLNDSLTTVEQPLNNHSTTVKQIVVNSSKYINSNKVNKEDVVDCSKDPYHCYSKNIGLMSPFIKQQIDYYLQDGLEEALIVKYIETAIERNKGNWAYIKTMIDGNAKLNIITLEQYEAHQVTFKNQANKDKDIPTHRNFDEREYAKDELEQYYTNVHE